MTIGKYNNKILDVVFKSRICQGCAKWTRETDTDEYTVWYEEHKDYWDANHEGSSGKIEVDGIIEIFKRSEELYGIKYAHYIGDGDNKTFKSLLDAQPYDDELIVQKKECVLLIKKRLHKRGIESKKNMNNWERQNQNYKKQMLKERKQKIK